jgi:hypothetical protein
VPKLPTLEAEKFVATPAEISAACDAIPSPTKVYCGGLVPVT